MLYKNNISSLKHRIEKLKPFWGIPEAQVYFALRESIEVILVLSEKITKLEKIVKLHQK